MTRARSVSRLGNSQALSVDSSFNVGINSTSPVEKLNVVGVVSATSFHGSGANLTNLSAANLSGTLPALNGSNLTDLNGSSIASGTVAAARVATLNQNTTGTAGGLTGTPDITINNLVGVAATFTGVLTYEDVTNVDSIGIVTARAGVRIIGAGMTVAGISTFHDGADIEGFKVEDGQTAATPNGEFNFYLANGHFFRYTGTPGADYYPNFKHSASVNLNDRMDVNDVVSATLIVNSPAATYHIANTIHIDGNAHGENSYSIDTDWVGGSAPDAGNGSGHDVYSFTIIKTADKTFTIIANSVGAA